MPAGSSDPLVVLLELTRKLTDDLTLEDALEAVTDAALPLLGADHASIRLLDDTGKDLLSGARSGKGKSEAPFSFKPGQGVAGWVAEHGEVARIDDVEVDPRFLKRAGQGFEVRAMLAVPLWSAGHVVGVLSVSRAHREPFDDRDELMTRLLANCAVPAFERARLERLAVTDPHTRAFNRRYLVPRLIEEMARVARQGGALSLLLMDLDHFKRVNDEHGHAAGDRVLREFADRVRHATRVQDALVRWGGEEFVLVMPDTERGRAREVAERIRAATADAAFEIGNGDTRIAQTVSIGQVTWNGRETPEELEQRADQAMYAAKRAGRDRVVSAEG
jgi:diguanylate cyclase (GGDEF)-like protein